MPRPEVAPLAVCSRNVGFIKVHRKGRAVSQQHCRSCPSPLSAVQHGKVNPTTAAAAELSGRLEDFVYLSIALGEGLSGGTKTGQARLKHTGLSKPLKEFIMKVLV